MYILKHSAQRTLHGFGRALPFCVLIAVLVSGDRLLAADISIPRTVAHSTNVSLDVSYTALGASVAGLQFDLKYDRSAVTITASAGPAAATAGKSLSSNVLPNGITRFLIVGFNQNVIPDGVIVVLSIQFAVNAHPGPYPLRIINPFATNATGQGVPILAHSGRIVKAGRHERGRDDETGDGDVADLHFLPELPLFPARRILPSLPL